MRIDWPDHDWPFLLWVNPAEDVRSEVDADQIDFSRLGWRSRALLRASLQRALTRLDEMEGR